MRLQFDECTFDTESRQLICGGNEVRLTAKAFQLLTLLLEERPNPVSKQTILERVWPDTFVSEANLASLIKEIRSGIGDDAKNPRFVRTAHRFGYAFSGPVVELPEDQRPITSLAVLPFENLTSDPSFDLLVEGIAETLINTLSSAEGLRVTPRIAAFRYKAREVDPAMLRRELNVQGIVTGRVRLSGPQATVQAELTDLTRNVQVWGKQFTAPLSGLDTVQESLSRELSVALKLRSGGDEQRRLTRRYTSNHEAYQLYLRGRHHWNRRTVEGIERGIFYFQAAVDVDASYAPAYSGLADCWIALASRDLMPPMQLYPKAEEASRRALELDAELAEAHASLAAIQELFRWNWVEAEREYLTALRLNPSYVTGRQWYALSLAHRGRFREALRELEDALEADPLSVPVNTNTGVVRYLAREYEAAIAACEHAIEINPHNEPPRFTVGLCALQLKDFARARAELDRASAISHGEPHVVAALACVDAAVGSYAAAEERIQMLEGLQSVRYVSPAHFAVAWAALGDRERAFRELERAAEARSGWLVFLRHEPRFDALRDDRRFAELLRMVGLE